MPQLTASDLVIEGEYFIPYEKVDLPLLENVSRRMRGFLSDQGFIPADFYLPPVLGGQTYHTIKMVNKLPVPDLDWKMILRHKVGLLSKERYAEERYLNSLSRAKSSAPHYLTFHILPGTFQNRQGVKIIARVHPIAYSQMQQISRPPRLDEFQLSTIIENGSQQIQDVMHAIPAFPITEPRRIGLLVEENLVDKLQRLGFAEPSRILAEGYKKIDSAHPEDSIVNLRSCLEIFVQEITKGAGLNAHGSLNSNLSELGKNGYLEGAIEDVLQKFADKTYSLISDKPTHKRQKPSRPECYFMFSTVEAYIRLLISKVIYKEG